MTERPELNDLPDDALAELCGQAAVRSNEAMTAVMMQARTPSDRGCIALAVATEAMAMAVTLMAAHDRFARRPPAYFEEGMHAIYEATLIRCRQHGKQLLEEMDRLNQERAAAEADHG